MEIGNFANDNNFIINSHNVLFCHNSDTTILLTTLGNVPNGNPLKT